MPLHEPDDTDPMELVGVRLPAASDESTRTMAECFVEEFARLGYDQHAILELFRNPEYAAAHDALRVLGETHIAELAEAYSRAFRTWREMPKAFEV